MSWDNFECPNCKDLVEKVDDKFFSAERIQGSDALNADPLSSAVTKVELWYCFSCNGYFKAYYKLDRIAPLMEIIERKKSKDSLSCGSS